MFAVCKSLYFSKTSKKVCKSLHICSTVCKSLYFILKPGSVGSVLKPGSVAKFILVAGARVDIEHIGAP